MAPLTPRAGPSKSGTMLHGLDKVALRLGSPLTRQQLAWLRKQARSVDQRLGRPMGKRRCPILLTIVGPTRSALEALATLAEEVFVNRVELALEILADSQQQAMDWSEISYRHVIHPRHGKQVSRLVGNGWYTAWRKRGLTLCGYGDRDSKISTGPACRIEARMQGSDACRRVIDVVHPRDLLTIDHHAFWDKHGRFYELDLQRLGRHHQNRVNGERRKTPRPNDVRVGSILFRARTDELGAIQPLVDSYGMGPWLHRVPLVALLMVHKPRRRAQPHNTVATTANDAVATTHQLQPKHGHKPSNRAQTSKRPKTLTNKTEVTHSRLQPAS